jgi:phosphoenolpyruvate carboxylase
MLASVYGHLAVMTALVAAGADVNAANEVLCEGDVWVYIQAHVGSHFIPFRGKLRHSWKHPVVVTRRW